MRGGTLLGEVAGVVSRAEPPVGGEQVEEEETAVGGALGEEAAEGAVGEPSSTFTFTSCEEGGEIEEAYILFKIVFLNKLLN